VTQRWYVETSALLRVLLDGDEALRPLLAGAALFTSALTFVEAARAIARARREGRLEAAGAREAGRQLAAFERTCDVVRLGDEVLARARGEFPVEPVRSLDALHLASAQVLDDELGAVVVVSCDERLRRNATAMGFAVVPAPEHG